MKYVRFDKWWMTGDSIHVDVVGEDEQVHGLDVAPECAEVLAAVLAAGSQQLGADGRGQFIRPTGLQTGKTAQDEPILMITLDGGAQLPLVFKAEALGVLISELEKLQSILQPGSQIRWQ